MKTLVELIVTISFVILLFILLKHRDNDAPLPEILGEEFRNTKEQFNKGFHKKDSLAVDTVKIDTTKSPLKWPTIHRRP